MGAVRSRAGVSAPHGGGGHGSFPRSARGAVAGPFRLRRRDARAGLRRPRRVDGTGHQADQRRRARDRHVDAGLALDARAPRRGSRARTRVLAQVTATIATRSIHDRLVRRLRITALIAVPLTLSVSPGVAQLPGVKPRIFRPETQGGHMKLLAVALLGLTLAACGSPPTWTLWQVNTSVGTVTDIKELEKGLERTACELVKQGHVKSAQAITSGNGLLV